MNDFYQWRNVEEEMNDAFWDKLSEDLYWHCADNLRAQLYTLHFRRVNATLRAQLKEEY